MRPLEPATASSISFEVSEFADPDGEGVVVRGLVAYNEATAGPEDWRALAVLARSGGVVIGGLRGYSHWSWLFVNQLWVVEQARSRGIGSELMARAEAEAATRGCVGVHLDTFDFQALPFYEQLGYEQFGRLDDFPPGHNRYFLVRRLA
jgi:GNAT superfamily N-acetyltransferase